MENGESLKEWTAEELRSHRRKLEERRQRQLQASRGLVGILLGLVVLGVLLRLPPGWWVPAVGFVALAGLVFRMTNWKCPACGERLPTRGSGTACPGCGLPLEGDGEEGP